MIALLCAVNPTAKTRAVKPLKAAKIENVASMAQNDFEKAVKLIKKYETLHGVSNWPYVGYGHLVKKGENIPKRKMSEAEADALLRKDLKENMQLFKDYGKDQLLLAVLAYSVGPYRLLGSMKSGKSAILRKLRAGNRNIKSDYLAYCKYNGRHHKGIQSRRSEEFELLFKG